MDYCLLLYATALQQTYGTFINNLLLTIVEIDFETPAWFLPLTDQASELIIQHLVDEPLFSPLFPSFFLYMCASYGIHFNLKLTT